MKFALLTLSALVFAVSAIASSDSVAFFYNPEKVVVLINERSQTGRLNNFMNHFGNNDVLNTTSIDQKINISCARGQLGIACTFKFFPSELIQIRDRSLIVQTNVAALGFPSVGAFEMSFASSMKDKFNFAVKDNGEILMTGSKLIGQ
ncbi:hypothetical protein [Peredibacter starrii]|uniref:Uncharacterized protein n=1 Tax=Peredibacter starrii TaxID=28202 RepID=A0AAX4HV97_9BACT|nr:hypothetical protein [Peredibacter starrii]WPU67192.1 hypothetical protein SOO65_10540 [Peredibacter starrii]